MKQYESYKSSSFDWMGDIPTSWSIAPIKNTTDGLPSSFIDGDWIESDVIADDGIRYLTTGNVGVLSYKEQGSGYISQETFDSLRCSEVYPGDILISRLNLPLGRCCMVPNLGKRIVTAVDNVIYRPDERFLIRAYAVYLMNSRRYAEYMETLGRGTTMKRISRTILGNVKICIPPRVDQLAIVRYLDYKTSKIDAAISAIDSQIEDLNAYRQSIIRESVIKGLRADIPMKDSGIEWFGLIPENWQVLPLKYLFTICSGSTPDTNTENYWDGAIKWITPADYKTEDKYVSTGRRNITEAGLDSCSSSLLPIGSIVFSKRAPIGSVAITDCKLCTNQGCLGCIPKGVSSTYYYYCMSILKEQFNLYGSGTTFKEISATDFSNFKIVVPPYETQKQIADYLDNKVNRIATAIKSLEDQRKDLASLKQSIISEAVTGKIDVRDWTPINE